MLTLDSAVETSVVDTKYHMEIHAGRGVVIGDGARVTQVIQAAPELAIPPPPEPEQLPETTEFVGRDAELAEYANRLRTAHLVVIAGAPGMGKTWLAAQLARQAVAPDHVFWYAFHESLGDGHGIEALIWKLAAFLARQGQDDLWRMLQSARLTGGQTQPPEVLFDYLIQLLRGRGYLLCLDDFEHVDADPLVNKLVRRLAAIVAAGELALIFTSRRIPTFVRAVAPLTGLSLEDARRLLATRGLALAADLTADLHGRTGGSPQLLTLAVNALRGGADPARLVGRLAEEQDIARYLMAEVHKRLTKEEQAVMAAVSVLLDYSGTRDAVEAILDAGAWEALTALSDRYLLTATEGPHGCEYGQHAIVQAFYYSQLGRRQRREMHHRAGGYYEREEPDLLKAASHFQRAEEPAAAARLATADVWALINLGQAGALRRLLEQFTGPQLEAELWARVNIARGQMYALARESQLARSSFEQGLATLEALANSPTIRKPASAPNEKTPRSDIHARLRQQLTDHFNEEELRTLCFDLGLDYESLPAQGKAGKARELVAEAARSERLQELIAQSRSLRPHVAWEAIPKGDEDATASPSAGLPEWLRELMARAYRGMGDLLKSDSPKEALTWLNRGLDVLASTGGLEAAALHTEIGWVYRSTGDFVAAQDVLERGLDSLPPGPSPWRAAGLINLGVVYCVQGNAEKGKDCYRRALEITRQLGDHWRALSARHNLAVEAEIAGQWDEATAEYQTVLALAKRLGSLIHQVNLALALGMIETKRGRDEDARTHLMNCLTMAREYALLRQLVFAQASLADLYLRQGKLAVAEPLLIEAESLVLEIDSKDQQPEIYRNWAQVRLAQGQIDRAHADAERSVRLAHELGLENEEGMSQRVLGQALLAHGQSETAVAAFQQSLALLAGRDPYEAARTQVQWGLHLVSGPDPTHGAALLQEARTTLERLGARHDLAQLEALVGQTSGTDL